MEAEIKTFKSTKSEMNHAQHARKFVDHSSPSRIKKRLEHRGSARKLNHLPKFLKWFSKILFTQLKYIGN